MPTKKQHFVPRVYLKAWETQVETLKEPDKKFKGIYVIKDGKKGEGANRNSVLWMPHLYTINFKYLFICNSCSKVKSQFVDMIFDLLRKSYKQPVYGKIGYSTIKTKKSIQKHLYEIDDWEFYYEDGNIAKKAAILSQIDALNSYVLEDAFDDYLEKNWENILNSFVDSVHNGTPVAIGRNERIISEDIAKSMLASFFILLCRNPKFDAMGIYTQIKDNILYPVFDSMCKEDEESEKHDIENNEGKEYADELMTGIWYSELYKMFFKNSGGFYHNVVNLALKGCQMILFEAYENAGTFITSDNPAFEHRSTVVEKNNSTRLVFPISPKYLIFIDKGNEGINVVDHRFANTDTIKKFNRMIYEHKTELIVSMSNNLNDVI
uniref:DUF4238 domain-containing protein n=1 Tax=Eshraghiella crossota TaxID=45851 RepID=UPI0040255E19